MRLMIIRRVMIFEHTSYRSYLKAILAERITTNRSYSLRALARDTKVHPSQMSAIFNGQKGLSLQSGLRVAERLGLGAQETEYFCLLIQYESATSDEVKDVLLTRLRAMNRGTEIRELSVDLFKMISDWYHLPILEMLELKNFDYSSKNIASRLGISPLEAETAIERLERLELIEKDERGRYKKAQNDLLVKTKQANQAAQRFHRQMLIKAAESFENQEPKDRYIGAQTFAVDPAQLTQAREIADRVRVELNTLFDQGTKRTEVYQLGVQLFRLTKKGATK